MKLDAKFYGEIRKAKNDEIVPEEEWICFLVKDAALPSTLDFYRRKCEEFGADAEQIDAIDRLKDRVMIWRRNNPDRIKTPDAKGEKLLDRI
jgi:hypothetical protein